MNTAAGTLEARDLIKRFAGTQVIHGVNLKLQPGQIVGYLGPNGSGKTVTTHMLTGLLEPNSGAVLYNGQNIDADLVAFRRHLGYVPEEPHLYPFLNAREYLQLVGRLRLLDEKLLDAKISALLELFGIAHAADKALDQYSKGMKQKVLISAALLHDPDVLIFDEPESGLDVTSILVLRHLVRLLAARGKAILYSSHMLEAVEKVCHRVIVIDRGRVVADDGIEHLTRLMQSRSLEETFTQLVTQRDPIDIARAIVEVAVQRA